MQKIYCMNMKVFFMQKLICLFRKFSLNHCNFRKFFSGEVFPVHRIFLKENSWVSYEIPKMIAMMPSWCTSFYTVVIQNTLYLSLNLDLVNTRKSQADGVFLEVPHFVTSVYKSSKQFGLSFA